MGSRGRRGGAIILAVAVFGGLAARSEAQYAPGGFAGANWESGMTTPHLPPEGVWAEVVTATPKWLVLQNQDGQQFPVSYDSVRLFLMRWPTAPNLLAPDAWLEATGIDTNSNSILAGHVDVYEGAAKAMVTPTLQTLIGYNRILTPGDVDQITSLGIYYPLLPGESAIPRRIHVVGPLIGVSPLAVATSGNSRLAIVGAMGYPDMTLVTQGTTSSVQAGDVVWCLPVSANTRSLALAQLVVFKKVPQNRFAP
jgi:hypothetical protein